jgi:hypothetical protein
VIEMCDGGAVRAGVRTPRRAERRTGLVALGAGVRSFAAIVAALVA